MSALFSPLTIGPLTFANRIAVSPMCQYSATDGVAADWHLVHLGALANSGAGLVVVEATAVEPIGRITPGDLGLYDDATQEALARVVSYCRRHGQARLGIQLGHAGRKASTRRPWDGNVSLGPDEGAWRTIAPSALPFDEGWHVPRAMDEGDITRVRTAFADSARRAVELGFDVIEIHVAHGYLLHEFMSPLSNQRTDGYGGTLEGRMRFPLDLMKAVRDVVPAHIVLGARITGSDFAEGGLLSQDAVVLATRLRELGTDFVCVSGGGLVPNGIPKLGPAYQADLAAHVRRESGITTRSVGLIATPAQAEAVIAQGKADFVAIGRGFLDNPHWAWEAARVLGAKVIRPPQYQRASPEAWKGVER